MVRKIFIFGFEESYGYLAGTYTRDKDAVLATGLFATMVFYYQQQGLTVIDRLQQLRDKYGYFCEELESVYLEGKAGQEQIDKILTEFRENRQTEIAGKEVEIFKDFQAGISYDYENDRETEISLPQARVLQYFFADESLLTIRPSGTEPKLKIYFSVRGDTAQQATQKMQAFKDKILPLIDV